MIRNVEESEKLSIKQQEAIKLIILGYSVEEIAKKLKVNHNTIYRWRKQDVYKNALSSKQDDIANNVYNKIKSLSIKSLKVLEQLLENADNENNKLKASMFILDKMIQLNDENLIEKLNNIESLLSSNK